MTGDARRGLSRHLSFVICHLSFVILHSSLMRILLELAHPKHVHFFRPLLKRWRARGDAVQIVTRDKDITHALLDAYGLPYVALSRQQRANRAALELVARWMRFARWIARFHPDVTLSVAGITTAPPSRLARVPNIALTDTETARASNAIALPFADRVLTPAWFNGDFGAKHFRYRGFHEWAYLHPDEFRADASIVRGQGANPDEPYALVRLVKWDAAHDTGESGFARDDAIALVARLARKMRVYVSSEAALPRELTPYAAHFHVDAIHHVIAFAALIVGESPSMATEAALLGAPSVLCSSWAGQCGNMQVLEQRYGLIRVSDSSASAVESALALADNPPTRAEITARRERLIAELECVPDVVERHIAALLSLRGARFATKQSPCNLGIASPPKGGGSQ